jgi:hypothetical protein
MRREYNVCGDFLGQARDERVFFVTLAGAADQ